MSSIVQQFGCIVADPPWAMPLSGKRKRAKGAVSGPLEYPTMSTEEICRLDVASVANAACHLWLWTTNSHIEDGFKVMRAWGFKYLAPIHWIKPSGVGNWFIHRTQTALFGYRLNCKFPLGRYLPNIVQTGDPVRHSQKPEEFFKLVESVSIGPRLEMFARTARPGWSAWGNEVASDVTIPTAK